MKTNCVLYWPEIMIWYFFFFKEIQNVKIKNILNAHKSFTFFYNSSFIAWNGRQHVERA